MTLQVEMKWVSASQGLLGSLRSTNDAARGGEVDVSASQGLAGDPRVLGCTGCTGIDSGDSRDDTINEDSCKIGAVLEVRAFRRSPEQSHASTALGCTPRSL